MSCCTTPGCRIKDRRDFEVEYTHALLAWKLADREGRMPVLQQPLGLMAHTAPGSETHRLGALGASLKGRVMDTVEIRINKKSSPEMIHLVLNLDEKYRKTAAQKTREIAGKTRA